MTRKNREPNFERLRVALLRQGEPDVLPFMELKYDHEIMEAILGKRSQSATDRDTMRQYYRLLSEFYQKMGHDYIRGRLGLSLPLDDLKTTDTAELAAGNRTWRNESRGPIASWADFDRYPWPEVSDIDEAMAEGMKVIGMAAGILEYTTWLFGYEQLCYALYDQPDLVRAVTDRIGQLWADAYKAMASMEEVGALCLGDDMGFKSGTLVSPEVLREYIFPWQKQCVQAAHAYDKPFILHSDGELSTIMDDLIDYVGIDAKHAYEDVITPVSEAKKRWGDRVAIVGGVDVDMLARGSEQQVREYTRRVILSCAPGGGYMLGSGNSITNYCPVENVLAMYDEGRKLGTYPIGG